MKYICLFLVFIIYLKGLAQDVDYSLYVLDNVTFEDMENGFNKVPNEAKTKVFGFWNEGLIDKKTITSDFEELKAKGFGGVLLSQNKGGEGSGSENVLPPPISKPLKVLPLEFGSKEWLSMFSYATQEADRLGLELTLEPQSGWMLGGPSVKPEESMKIVVFSEKLVNGPQTIKLELDYPDTILLYKDIVIHAIKTGADINSSRGILNWDLKSFNKIMGSRGIYPLYKYSEEEKDSSDDDILKKDEIVDLTSHFKNGILEWDVPEGEWNIIRFGMTSTGHPTHRPTDGSLGLVIDHMSKDALKSFFDKSIQPLIDASKLAGTSLKGLMTESWEQGMCTWTQNFKEEFYTRRGYDITPYMPVLANKIVENRSVSNRFLYDYRRTIGDLIAENHYKYFAELSHQNGLYWHPESGGPHAAPINALQTMSYNDAPMGEFWSRANTHRIDADQRLYVKQSASVAHTNGKRFVFAEGPSSIGPMWERSPIDLKGVIDRVFCEGVNKVIWAVFTSSPVEFGLPGIRFFACTNINPNLTWWNQSAALVDYMNRCSYLLSLGLFNADVLYYNGGGVPNFVFLKESQTDLNFGYDYDKCGSEVILNRASVNNNKLYFPDGMNYSVLVLPDETSIRLDVLRKIEELVKDGLVLLGPKPQKALGLTGYPDSDTEVQSIADRVWGNIDGERIFENKYGKGKVFYGRDINEVLQSLQIEPDFKFKSNLTDTQLDYIHRSTKDAEIYFVVNRHARKGINDFTYRYLTDLPDRYETVECSFRVKDMVPEIWDPVSGKTMKIVSYKIENGRTVIPLNFTPEESKFIIFRKMKVENHIVGVKKDGINLFPMNDNFPASINPQTNFDKNGKKIMADVFNDGKYDFEWSDGKQTTLNVRPFSKVKQIDSPWKVEFSNELSGLPLKAPKPFVTDELKSLTQYDDEDIKYYSGTVKYFNTFELDKNEDNKVFLDLGNVQELADIYINDIKVGTSWFAPFRMEITDFVKEGENQLQVDVVNLWVNRLIGDSKKPQKERSTNTNVTKFNVPDSEQYLRVSGLLGPVKIIYAKQVTLRQTTNKKRIKNY